MSFIILIIFSLLNIVGANDADYILPSVKSSTDIHTRNSFSVYSIVVDDKSQTNWVIPSRNYSNPPLYQRQLYHEEGEIEDAVEDMCHVRFIGLMLKQYQPGFRGTGHGYLTYADRRNQNDNVTCYYVTNEKRDYPSTVSIAGVCPIPRSHPLKSICSQIERNDLHLTITLLYKPRRNLNKDGVNETMEESIEESVLERNASERTLVTEVTARSHANRFGEVAKDINTSSLTRYARFNDQKDRHAVCTVQVFKNKLTSAKLFLFISYHLTMGWTVIVYDRYGMHADVVEEFRRNVQFNYYPFTVFESLFPERYNAEAYEKTLSEGVKFYFAKETNDASLVMSKDELHNQDSDKQKTYDLCRSEFSHSKSIVFVDADELFNCPKVITSVKEQAEYQKDFMDRNIKSGYSEIHLPRNTHFFKLPRQVERISEVRFKSVEDIDIKEQSSSSTDISSDHKIELSTKDLIVRKTVKGNETVTEILTPYVFVNGTNYITKCMLNGYKRRSVSAMLGCWTRQFRHVTYPKHADLNGECPFHWNHFSCFTTTKHHRHIALRFMCKCKVNELYMKSFKRIFNGCHVMHLSVMTKIFKGNDISVVKDRSEISFTPSMRAYPMWVKWEEDLQ